MTAEYILAIDQGKTTTRVLAFSLDGEILGLSQKEITQYYPQNGWVEHDGEEIWDKTVECLSDVVQKQNKQNRKAIAVGITNQACFGIAKRESLCRVRLYGKTAEPQISVIPLKHRVLNL